jgi:hypothetical protein
MNRPAPRLEPPTREILERTADPRSLPAGLILLDHGISPYDVPMRGDAFEPTGYLVVTEFTDTGEILCERRPWPDVETWNALQPHLEQTRAYLEGRI